ncbi:PIN domain-containing protein [Candidatus Methylacidithermus pantelleriae]|uniref:Uncharacterized protein n=1 Tax=Candidatus Methylacidithermus pantelleriae TaxID=2744239 RepID=A0A8J2BVY9_9BACT|nr:hypothetical protein [Candidatus Methylacidithermus pantelleriae]CAF0705010.1 hypothetical protein MPNT_80065 [Candidatus Methylacidithermus pantelleriae]
MRVGDRWDRVGRPGGADPRDAGITVTYDAHYLLVIEELSVEFWTDDKRLGYTVERAVRRDAVGGRAEKGRLG